MLPGFFLGIAENTGDRFSYVILPANNRNDIPVTRNPVTLVRSVIRKRNISSDSAPRCVQSREGFHFFTRDDVELFGDEELDMVDADLDDYLSVSDEEQDVLMESQSFLSEYSNNNVNELLSQLDKDIFSVAEETDDIISEEQHEDVVIEPVLVQQAATTPEIPTASPFAPPSVPLVSQTQPEVEDVDSDNEDDSDPIAGRYSTADFDSMASDVNNVFDPDNQCDREELDSIIEH